MNPPAADPSGPVVLAVDDEVVSLKLLEYFLKKAGHRTVTVDSAEAARRFVAQHGPAAVHCVVTDYRMPVESGLELLLWLKQHDAALSVIMITATTEREFVAETLRGGAADFLDKPITEAKLRQAVDRGIELTTRRRQAEEAARVVRQVGRTQHQLFGLGGDAAARLDLCYHPRHQAGGDFVNYFQLGPDRFLVLIADVSGHDLHAAFVSAYFQGMMSGMIESGQAITTVFAKFNRLLVAEWGARTDGAGPTSLASLSVCSILVDLSRGHATFCNQGAPRPWQVDAEGWVHPVETPNGHPLGWFDDLEVRPGVENCPPGGNLVLWTDGLEDLALDLQVSPLSLAAGIRHARGTGETPPALALAQDDVLVVFIRLAADAAGAGWRPLLAEYYRGDRQAGIDAAQAFWERSLGIALPDLSESRRFDVLLALRESVINALLHGCAGRADLWCRLSVAADPAQRSLRAIVSDPGPGHEFTALARENDHDIADLHRGLSLVSRLATRVTSRRRGAELILDFRY
jgi:sigma-B regulation protein RsbU (phosphoserine phosphatase)